MGERENKVSAAKVSEWMIERLAQGELDPGTAQSVRARLMAELGSEAAVAARLAALAQDNRETLDRLPATLMAPKIRARAEETARAAKPAATPRTRPLVWLSPVAVAAMAALVYVGTRGPGAAGTGPTHEPGAGEEHIITKGSARLLAFRATSPAATEAEQLAPNATVRPHDLLQLAYTVGEPRFGVVVSVDGRGGVTQHLPGAAGNAASLSAAGAVRLPSSYELDESPGFERFFLVTSGKPFATAAVMAAAQALAKTPAAAATQALALPAELSQESLLLKKVTP